MMDANPLQTQELRCNRFGTRRASLQTMVDSPKEETMTNGADNLPERMQAIEQKLDALASSVDRRFDQVDAAIVEQRAYTEFAVTNARLEDEHRLCHARSKDGWPRRARPKDGGRPRHARSEMEAGFAGVDREMEAGLATLDRKMEVGFAGVDREMEVGFATLDRKMEASFAGVDGRFARLERKSTRLSICGSRSLQRTDRPRNRSGPSRMVVKEFDQMYGIRKDQAAPGTLAEKFSIRDDFSVNDRRPGDCRSF